MSIEEETLSEIKKIEGQKLYDILISESTIYPIGIKSEGVKQKGIQLKFENYRINIYNPIYYWGISESHINELKNVQIKEMRVSDSAMFIVFDRENITLEIDLKEDSYLGPEALVIYGPNSLCIVI